MESCRKPHYIYKKFYRKEENATKSSKKTKKSIEKSQPMSPEARENQVISAAMDLAEQQILDGTASSQVITHFLKLGTQRKREELEMKKLEREVELLSAKTDALNTASHIDELYKDAIEAMKRYSGAGDSDD